MTTFADRAIPYYHTLTAPTNLPPGLGVMNPYQEPAVQAIVSEFYGKFYNDTTPRVFVLGINPGRFGAGVTGISFTTPQNLDRYCGIANSLLDTGPSRRPELSSRFIYQVVDAFGGAGDFYGRFFLTSLFPLALTKDGKNYNFYDDRLTTDALWPAITEAVRTQTGFGYDRRVAVCLGRKNETYLHRLNDQQGFFDRIVTLDHPRYILQYKAKSVATYLDRYITTLHDCLDAQ
ncbi:MULTISPECIES: uracil-DNA glycosylase family protein [Spirosoma]|uniref:SMUG2 DNA glycosylase family protein n=1 Tax=Spirosoma sordidisoli TaxID=2502893 RepID=A0A4Q2UHD5_9BACT|nr:MULTISPECIES: uracil-DNA glycosylase family protein [Spirosoma]RYC67912.1 SMUG2 DNA glycosylase family protein [Spirosoma sordidisoli]